MESMDIDSSVDSALRTDSIWLHGVDNLSTKDIKAYLKNFIDFDFKIEWVNDTSLNVVFEDDEDAKTSLKKLTKEGDKEFLPTDEREAQLFEDKPEVLLTLRMSNLSDKKVKNAAQYSRYYLYNPPKHEFTRRRPKSRSSSSGEYREREPVVFRRSRSRDRELEDAEANNEESDDGNDLFPDKATSKSSAKKSIRKSEDLIEVEEPTSDLLSRIGKASDKSQDDDGTQTSGSLLGRIGSKFADKKLANDDLFG